MNILRYWRQARCRTARLCSSRSIVQSVIARSCRRGVGLALAACLFCASGALGAADAEQIFVCGSGTEGEPETLLELRAVPLTGRQWAGLRFFGTWPDQTPIRYPAVSGAQSGQFSFANSIGPDGYVVTVRFWIDQAQFRLFSVYREPKPGDDGIGDGEAGLEIQEPDGTTRRIVCEERPFMFISAMRDSMACDDTTELGAAACDTDQVPVRQVGRPLW